MHTFHGYEYGEEVSTPCGPGLVTFPTHEPELLCVAFPHWTKTFAPSQVQRIEATR